MFFLSRKLIAAIAVLSFNISLCQNEQIIDKHKDERNQAGISGAFCQGASIALMRPVRFLLHSAEDVGVLCKQMVMSSDDQQFIQNLTTEEKIAFIIGQFGISTGILRLSRDAFREKNRAMRLFKIVCGTVAFASIVPILATIHRIATSKDQLNNDCPI